MIDTLPIHAPLVHHTLSLVMAMIGLAMLLNLWRLLRGPTVPDRILALDTLYINTVALVILFGIRMGTSMYFEVALVIAMLGFVGTVALSKYVMRRDIIE
ncbi:MAG: K+/H+ antiporter subunit F [Gammaproteobacteria bacterium HGW-Gammaproteobacteria-5]|jgi:multicomponent K+:H+ antiporter subunit F|nr:MAG: K+/H+ antiporter subunit F [Gammaproteobacteria bacterium HGW-Gammaproteobacteria-5]PKM16221.1 MAG: K+/H+ antiporter subunit F [Gammaproteobacteria bacterium HGW-Gammaproteobacteria-2]